MNLLKLFKILIGIILLSIGCTSDPPMNGSSMMDPPRPDTKIIPEEVESDSSVAFVGVNVVPMDREQILADQTVLIQNGMIAQIGPSASTTLPASVVKIVSNGSYLMPGLAGMHAHLIVEGDLLPLLANGVTTILNMGEVSAPVLFWRNQIQLGERIGPTVYAGAWTRSGDATGPEGQKVRTPGRARSYIRQKKNQGYDFIKVWSVGANGFSPEVFAAIMEEAANQGYAVMGHARGTFISTRRALELGQVMVAHAEEYFWSHFNATHNTSLIQDAIDFTLNSGAYVTPSLMIDKTISLIQGNVEGGLAQLLAQPGNRFLDPNGEQRWRNQINTSNLSPPGSQPDQYVPTYNFIKSYTKAFSDAGVPLLLGSDMGYVGSIPGFTIHEEMQILSEIGLTPYQILETGTKNASEFITQYIPGASAFGIIEPGRQADLILLDANPLEDIANVKNRVGVMTRGHWFSETKLEQMLEELAQSYGN